MADLDIDRNALTVVAKGADTNQVAGTVLLTYTCPGGKTAILRYVANNETTTGGTIQQVVRLEWVRGATVVELDQFDNNADVRVDAAMDAGDLVRLVVHTQGTPAAINDLLMSIEERSARRNN